MVAGLCRLQKDKLHSLAVELFTFPLMTKRTSTGTWDMKTVFQFHHFGSVWLDLAWSRYTWNVTYVVVSALIAMSVPF